MFFRVFFLFVFLLLANKAKAYEMYLSARFDPEIYVLETDPFEIIATITVSDSLTRTIFSPSGDLAYVLSPLENDMVVIDTETRVIIATLPVKNAPGGISILPTGNSFYATIISDFHMSVIEVDTTSFLVIATITISRGINPCPNVVTPNGSFVYASSTIGGTSSISVINTSRNHIVTTISIFGDCFDLLITPNGRSIYSVNEGEPGTVNVISTSSRTLIATITLPFVDQLWLNFDVTMSPDGTKIYFPTRESSDSVIVISTTTNTIVSRISTDESTCVAITPDGSYEVIGRASTPPTILEFDTSTNSLTGNTAGSVEIWTITTKP